MTQGCNCTNNHTLISFWLTEEQIARLETLKSSLTESLKDTCLMDIPAVCVLLIPEFEHCSHSGVSERQFLGHGCSCRQKGLIPGFRYHLQLHSVGKLRSSNLLFLWSGVFQYKVNCQYRDVCGWMRYTNYQTA